MRHGRVGHGAVGHQVPGLMTLGGSAHRLREDMYLHGLLTTVRLRHPGNADIGVVLDVGECCLDDASHRGVVGQLHLVGRAIA